MVRLLEDWAMYPGMRLVICKMTIFWTRKSGLSSVRSTRPPENFGNWLFYWRFIRFYDNILQCGLLKIHFLEIQRFVDNSRILKKECRNFPSCNLTDLLMLKMKFYLKLTVAVTICYRFNQLCLRKVTLWDRTDN